MSAAELREQLKRHLKSARYHRRYICETAREERAHSSARRVAVEAALRVRTQLRACAVAAESGSTLEQERSIDDDIAAAKECA